MILTRIKPLISFWLFVSLFACLFVSAFLQRRLKKSFKAELHRFNLKNASTQISKKFSWRVISLLTGSGSRIWSGTRFSFRIRCCENISGWNSSEGYGDRGGWCFRAAGDCECYASQITMIRISVPRSGRHSPSKGNSLYERGLPLWRPRGFYKNYKNVGQAY